VLGTRLSRSGITASRKLTTPIYQPDPALRRSRGPSHSCRPRGQTQRAPERAELAGIAEHISATERVAAEAEIESGKMKKLEFLELQLTEKNPQIFRAVVIEVRNYGLLIELPDVLLTGLVHVSSLQDDFYIFDEPRRRLIGRQSRRVLAVGDMSQVVVARIDVFKRQADFAIVTDRRRRANAAAVNSQKILLPFWRAPA
jgi:exoribonuclease R